MITKPLVGAFVVTLAAPLVSSATSITYNPEFNLDDDAVSNPYAISANTATPVESAISDGTASTSYSFSDATTGLAFSFDLNYSGVVDQEGSNNRLQLNPGESMTIAFGSITIDTSGYLDGTIGGITGPVNASVTSAGFTYFLAESFTDSILTVNNGSSDIVYYTAGETSGTSPSGIELAAENQDIFLAGVTDNLINFTATHDANGAIRLSDLGSSIVFEVTSIPEPATSALLFGVVGMALLGLARRR
ncbi:PEP-CTERM sorting domain-containing protein [Coraliomargarita algicola]|uniref:PEP-CTERM sorting domain-containing protein n=1 Tax=Coraliomargarita algicola TaxID=3092156 RepID=A0ABZ0RNS5_9BACT|nr:PEP-CTERM sorting domain-containing protein [Coraliomargarita sp. J2-16]WPJ96625.1 PEP-CTERM sorting domain-containing protein [Coraliomargarita sp. J2-16]